MKLFKFEHIVEGQFRSSSEPVANAAAEGVLVVVFRGHWHRFPFASRCSGRSLFISVAALSAGSSMAALGCDDGHRNNSIR
jgi:hypothetical protein